MVDARPVSIKVDPTILADLRSRIAATRWPGLLADGWDHGVDAVYLRALTDYWQHQFDWDAQQRAINTLHHYHAQLDGIRLHFVHERGTGPNPLPLVLTHGWPSTFWEMRKIIPMLTDPTRHGGDPDDSFDVIVPSLPGYGFSGSLTGSGWVWDLPRLWLRLLTEVLGYPRFAAHGVDIGAYLTNRLGLEHPDQVIGIHITQLPEPNLTGGPPPTDAERAFLAARAAQSEAGSGYAHIQRTRPQTLAYALADSPVGLAAWMVDKWRSWSDCDGDIERRFTKDELLTTITLYWVTETIASSVRLYREWGLASGQIGQAGDLPRAVPPGADAAPLPVGRRIEVPSAIALFAPGGTAVPPDEWIRRMYAAPRIRRMPRGGHFPALEEPELLVSDLRAVFRPLR